MLGGSYFVSWLLNTNRDNLGELVESERVESEMVYVNWNECRSVQYAQWTTVDALLSWLRSIRYMSFYIRANRDRIRVMYESLVGLDVVARDRRFPEEGFFVCMDNVQMRSVLDVIMHSLDMPDRQFEKNGMDVSNAGDAKRAFEVSVSELMRVLISNDKREYERYGVHDRESFERKFSLEWQ